MDKRQTAVEWLMEHITYDNGYGQRWVSFKEATDLNIYFQKALAMEKEQIIDANEDCSTNELGELFTGEQYYNETYGK
jgi:glycerol-3-phosphate O-acyltransferase